MASHLFTIAISRTTWASSPFLHIMEVRENMQDVKETIYGNRMNLSAELYRRRGFDMDDSLTVYMLERLDTVRRSGQAVAGKGVFWCGVPFPIP